MNTRSKYQLALAVVFCLCLPLPVRAQSFTNSATLSAAMAGTNLVVSYSLVNTQGWVTLFQAGSLTDLATNAQPFDLAPASATGQGQFTVPVNPAAPSQFYRLLIEQWPSRGKALVFTNGPLDFAAMRAAYGDITNNYQIPNGTAYPTNTTPMIFKQPVQVWLDNLGTYDSNGVQVADNAGLLWGKYLITEVSSLNNPGSGFPQINAIYSPTNDFRVNYNGDSNIPARAALLWSSQVQLYYDVNNYRKTLLNDAFVRELHLPSDLESNLISHQYRPDLNMQIPGYPFSVGPPGLWVFEDILLDGLRLWPTTDLEYMVPRRL